MYDILQLNDMLVPELLDIAEQLKIPAAKKLSKQELVYKILDKQAVVSSEKPDAADDKQPKARKRIVKTTTANSSEEAYVESGDPAPKAKKPEPKKEIRKKEEKPLVKKLRKKEEEEPELRETAPAAAFTRNSPDRPEEQNPNQDSPEQDDESDNSNESNTEEN